MTLAAGKRLGSYQVVAPIGAGSFSQTGPFVYVSGRGSASEVSIHWLGRDGKTQPLRETPALSYNPAFSPDGMSLALDIVTAKKNDVWVYSWERDTLTRLTFADDANYATAWTPDGKRITYVTQEKGGLFSLNWKRADGAGDAQRLVQGKSRVSEPSWSPDGKILAFTQLNPETGADLMTLTVEGDEKTGWKPGESKPFLNTPFGEFGPAFSPDGRWLAYYSNESGRFEIYVRPFPGPGGKWQISTGGGSTPQWSRNGRELFYLTPDNKIMVATYSVAGNSFRADKPTSWSGVQISPRGSEKNFALYPDGKRIAIFKVPGAEAQSQFTKVTIIFNFFDEVRRKLAASKP